MMRDNHGKVVGRPQAPEAQPWFWTITSLSICALLAVSSTAIAQNISAEDFDLACAVTAGAIFGSNLKEGAERDASKTVWTFYLGRLTGRDDKTIWNTVIKGRIAEMGEKAKSEELYGKCIDFYTVKTTE
jgi:hypothetical protein